MRRFPTTLVAILLSCPLLFTAVYAQTAEKPDLSKQPTLYVVGYAHLDTEWRWEYPQFTAGQSASAAISVFPRNGFAAGVSMTAKVLPPGVTASFSPVGTAGGSTMTLTAASSAAPITSTVSVTGASGALSHSVAFSVSVAGMKKGTVGVDLSPHTT